MSERSADDLRTQDLANAAAGGDRAGERQGAPVGAQQDQLGAHSREQVGTLTPGAAERGAVDQPGGSAAISPDGLAPQPEPQDTPATRSGAAATGETPGPQAAESGNGSGGQLQDGQVAAAGDGADALVQDNQGFRDRWTSIQATFVDEPRSAVEQADGLVAEVIQHLARTFADERSSLERQWAGGESVSTEDLRVSLQRYRQFFQALLRD